MSGYIVASTKGLPQQIEKALKEAWKSPRPHGNGNIILRLTLGEIKWNQNAMYDLRKLPALVQHLEAMGNKVARACEAESGGKFGIVSYQGQKRPQGRWQVRVIPIDGKARRAVATSNIIERNMFHAR